MKLNSPAAPACSPSPWNTSFGLTGIPRPMPVEVRGWESFVSMSGSDCLLLFTLGPARSVSPSSSLLSLWASAEAPFALLFFLLLGRSKVSAASEDDEFLLADCFLTDLLVLCPPPDLWSLTPENCNQAKQTT